MTLNITITPSGRLCLEEAPDAAIKIGEDQSQALLAAFADSSAAGLLFLASAGLELKLPGAMVFWRDLAKGVLHAVCRKGQEGVRGWSKLAAPGDGVLAEWVAGAPPMRGLEYVTVENLQRLWLELRDLMVERAAAEPDGPEAFLRGLNPVWHLLGRVTFHLAENKRDPGRPFAFLATYTHRLSSKSRLQHLPLAQALKEYANAKDQAQLAALLEPVRRAAETSPLVRKLLDTKALFRPQAWTPNQAYLLLKEATRIEESGVVLRLPDWWNPRRPPRAQVQVQLGKKPASQLAADRLLAFSVDVVLDGEPLTDEERREILSSAESLVLLRGKWVEANHEQLQQALEHWQNLQAMHPDGIGFVEGMRMLAGNPLDDPLDEQSATADWSRVTAGDWLRETLDQIRNPDGVTGCEPGRDLHATLRHYQVDGVKWLWFMDRLGLGACLADDMGLGKTIQVIDLLLHLKREAGQGQRRRNRSGRSGTSDRSTSLLVVPASLVGNWRQEFERFAPALRVFYAHRSECSGEGLERLARAPKKEAAAYDAIVTTYGLARRTDWLCEIPWRLVILDEAQAIKNASSAQTRAVKKLDAKGRIALTGTPVENHLGDLWSIIDFCCPGLLGSVTQFKQFVKRLEKQQDASAFGKLRSLVRPYILRRLKTDPAIAPDLPDKTEMRAECGLSKKQAALYEQAIRDLETRLENADGMARRGLVLSVLMQLKQICNHPSQYLNQADFTPSQSGKFKRLVQICEPIRERQEKVLVFTQFQSLTQPLADFLADVFGHAGLVLHGGTPVRKRKGLVRTFQQDGGPPFFVISVKAGGTGLNLTAASHVIHFDRWWNPAVENQATDRAFRIGQKRNVLVHKFVCKGTVEEQIDRMIHSKQEVADQILNQGGEATLTEMDDDELLRFVALDLDRAAEE